MQGDSECQAISLAERCRAQDDPTENW